VAGFCQSGEGVFASVKPDLTVVVTEHQTSAEIVEVTVLNRKYPPDLLRSQIESLGTYVGVAPRGLQVYDFQIDPNNKGLSFLKARFAVNGLIDRAGSKLRVLPIVKAFAGAPKPNEVKGIAIVFAGEHPLATTIKKYEDETVVLEAVAKDSPPSVEYRIGLKVQDPDRIHIPEDRPEPTAPLESSESTGGFPGVTMWAIVVAGAAAGVLVYLALLRGRGPAASNRR
jgi:hypothetical protein